MQMAEAMHTDTVKMNLGGAMDLIKKSTNPLTPIYEAITNSLEAISQRKYPNGERPQIAIAMYFTGLVDEVKELQQVEITDNGVGFTEENYSRFQEFFDKSKGYDNKGSGRLQFLHRFQQVQVESTYESDGKKRHRSCISTVNKFTHNHDDKVCDINEPISTTLSLLGNVSGSKEKAYFDGLKLDDLLKEIRSHFLLRFYLDTQKEYLNMPEISITFVKNGEKIGNRTLVPENILHPEKTGQITVPYSKVADSQSEKIDWQFVKGKSEVIKWAHFKVPEDDLAKNGIYLCSKDMPVQELKFTQIKKDESVNKSRYLTAFYGDVLDKSENVSDTVDSFKFPTIKEKTASAGELFFDEDEEFLFFDSIKDQVDTVIPTIYDEIIELRKNQEKDIGSIAKAHGIPMSVASKAKINVTDDEETITKKIFAEHSDFLATKGYKAKKIFESLSQLTPTDDDYQEKLEQKTTELSAIIEEQNKEELSRYILRREMVADILRKILSQELVAQNQQLAKGKNRDKEGLVHDLIFKRKSTETSALNDLWVLNEEFLHFEGCSELKLDQIKDSSGKKLLRDISDDMIADLGIKTDRRPDIFLFAEEGKCVLIELKAPDVDMSDHLNQLTKYCNLIANFSNQRFDRFYCYLIGEKINAAIDLPGDYEETINGDWVRSDLPIRSLDANRDTIASSQIEVIQLSSIYARAHRRNKSFADKLGLPDLLAD